MTTETYPCHIPNQRPGRSPDPAKMPCELEADVSCMQMVHTPVHTSAAAASPHFTTVESSMKQCCSRLFTVDLHDSELISVLLLVLRFICYLPKSK